MGPRRPQARADDNRGAGPGPRPVLHAGREDPGNGGFSVFLVAGGRCALLGCRNRTGPLDLEGRFWPPRRRGVHGVSPNGKLLATGGFDSFAKLWNLDTAK